MDYVSTSGHLFSFLTSYNTDNKNFKVYIMAREGGISCVPRWGVIGTLWEILTDLVQVRVNDLQG